MTATRRTILKAAGALVAAPAAFLWPKRAEGAIRYSRAYAEPKVAMTTWWWRSGHEPWAFRSCRGLRPRGFDCLQTAHYCEWSKVLEETCVDFLRLDPGMTELVVRWDQLDGTGKVLRYIRGAQMT